MSTDHARDRQGCLTCRLRKKKCPAIRDSRSAIDGDNERCPACKRLNLQCVWQNERALTAARPDATAVHVQKSSQSFGVSPILPSLEYGSVLIGDEPVQSLDHRRTALRYYVQSFAASLSTNEENNGFLSVLLPMAMESKPLLDVLIAWSTSHLALHHDNLRVRALEDTSIALRSFSTNLRDLPPDLSVAISLVLTSMESILGNTNGWYRHLAAAASMIRSTVASTSNLSDVDIETPLVSTAEGRWLLRNFAYHDVLASVSLNRDMLIPSSTEWLLLESDHQSVLDTYLGVGCVPVSVLGKISTLTRRLDGCSHNSAFSPDSEDTIMQVAHDLDILEEDLNSWRAPEAVVDEALRALAETYRSAALICLHRNLRFYGLRSPEDAGLSIAGHVKNVVDCMQRLPAGCLPECTLLFPLFIAGGEANYVPYQQTIAARMQAVVQNRSFNNVEIGLDILKEVWDVKSRTLPVNPARPYDWSSVLDRRKWELALS